MIHAENVIYIYFRLCDRKNWHTSRLVMALPAGHRAKDNVLLRSYTGSTKVQAVFDWVNFNLASRIREIYDFTELKKDWFEWEDVRQQTKVRIVLFSRMKIAPMFFSVLSVKFTGRAKFGTVSTNTKEGKNILNRLRFKKLPQYLVITPESNFTFGERSGEYLNYHSMALLLRTLHPEVNDIFLLSLVLVNIACWFELFNTQGNLFKRLGNMLWSIVKWNCVLILLWLPVLAIFQLPYMDVLLGYALKVLRMVGMTSFATHMRSDWLWYSSLHCGVLFGSFVIYATLVGILHYLYKPPQSDSSDTLNNNSDWWNFNWDGYVNYLFRPMATLTQPMTPQDMDLEVGMELLIERLAVPNFWLRPMISSDYIKDLPVWKYSGHAIDSDVYSDAEGSKSDGEESRCGAQSPARSQSAESLRKLPDMFTCEKCRALQNKERAKSEQELVEEQMDRESACAKFLMDGDYRCLCKSGRHGSDSRAGRHSSRSPTKTRARSLSPVGTMDLDNENEVKGQDDDEEISNLMPVGMLPVSECVICLETYKFGIPLCGLSCGHSFHHQCIMGWLSRDNHCCPVCRWPTYKAKPCSIHLHAE